MVFLAAQAKSERLTEEAERASRQALRPSEGIPRVFWDEMETFEHSKCLPLSIPLVVEPKTRRILGFRVASMPAKGLLAEISRKRYGRRKDERPGKVQSLWEGLAPQLPPDVEIVSDQNPKYPGWVRAVIPQAELKAFKGRRGCIVGQGELKRGGFDPLFDLNHTCAMLRANISRLVRRTWCTTKRKDRLEAHIEIYAQYHNSVLI